MKQRVIDLLIEWGNNPVEVLRMVELYYEYAARQYNTVRAIAECIRTLHS